MKVLFAISFVVLLPAGLVPPVALAQSPVLRTDRLERLAAYLDTQVSPAKFDIGKWGTTRNPDDPGYVGCAAGYATKLFRDEGFRYTTQPGPLYVTYRGMLGRSACREFFGLGVNDSNRLFTAAGCAGTDPHRAARNIRDVIARGRDSVQVAGR